MGKLTNKQIANYLSITTHRVRYPVVSWIEDDIRNGTADADFGEHCKEVIESVSLSFLPRLGIFSYNIRDGVVVNLMLGGAEEYIDNLDTPLVEEIDILQMVDPDLWAYLKEMAEDIKFAFGHPQHHTLNYHILEAECRCGKWGKVNYAWKGSDYEYYCGGSPRCIP